MINFKSKFLYIFFILRVLLLSAIIVSVFLFIFIGIPSLLKNHPLVKAIGLISFGIVLFSYLIIMLGKSFLTQRYSILIIDDRAILNDNIFGKHITLDKDFKGFSLSSYGSTNGLKDFKTLLFYFENGTIIELPQFLYSNFRDIMPALESINIKFLGYEPFIWKNLISRKYFFK